MIETLLGAIILSLLIAITLFFVQSVRESKRIERTLAAVYSLKEEIKKLNRGQGSYTQGRMMPVLFAAKAFPDSLKVNYERKQISTPLDTPLDVTGRGQHFSIDLYGLSPNDCYDFGAQIVAGNFFALGNTSDDLDMIKIGNMTFSDDKPLTLPDLQEACTQRFSIDVIMAFR